MKLINYSNLLKMQNELDRESSKIQYMISKELLIKNIQFNYLYWELYNVLKYNKYITKENAFEFCDGDKSVWCDKIKNYKTVFIRNCNCENFIFAIILYYGKTLGKNR